MCSHIPIVYYLYTRLLKVKNARHEDDEALLQTSDLEVANDERPVREAIV